MVINNKKHPIYFIAEIGQNHQGDINIAKKLVDSLRDLPVSCIKTAKRDIDVCLTEEQKNMIYDNSNSFGKTYYEHRKALEFSKDEFIEFKEYVELAGFDFLSSYTDVNSLDFLCDIGVTGLKIASQRLVDINLLKESANTGLPVIISTGMSNIEDIDKAIKILSNNEKYVLQCTSTYPCPENELNLNVIPMYKERYGNRIDGVGFSGHHHGVASDIAAYMLGAKIIERHYTLERSMKGTDHVGSLEKSGLKYVLSYISQVEQALGTSDKKVLESEMISLKKLRSDLI
jgi:sialic acid synthase SpsE